MPKEGRGRCFSRKPQRPAKSRQGKYFRLKQEQGATGWSSFFCGKLSPRWHSAQREFAAGQRLKGRQRGRPSKHPSRAAPSAFQATLAATRQAREERCSHRRRRGRGQQPMAELVQLGRELEGLHSLEEKALACGKHAFRIPLQEHKRRPPWKIKRWILRWGDALRQSAKAAGERPAAGSRRTHSYFLGASRACFAHKCRTALLLSASAYLEL